MATGVATIEVPFVPHPADEVMFESRLRAYDTLFADLGLLPMGERRLLDAGCGNGKFLDICCRRWGAREERAVGTDRQDVVWRRWLSSHPGTRLTFIHAPTHELRLPRASSEVGLQSMMLRSVVRPDVRQATADVLWALLAPGGLLVSYDFVLNPLNPQASGVSASTLRRLFPQARLRAVRRLTLAPP